MRAIREVLIAQNAYKSYECEDLLDSYFYRPVGALFALAGKQIGLSPNHLTIASLLAGVVGAALIYWEQWMWAGVGLIILSGVLDASDGQLARMTGSSSLAGRILDGVSDYLVFIAIYLALGFKTIALYPESSIFLLFLLIALAGISHSMQSSLFDYYRSAYVDYVERRRIPQSDLESENFASLMGDDQAGWIKGFLIWSHRDYTSRQEKLARSHAAMGERLRIYYPGAGLDENCSEIYRRINLPLIRLWNLLGPNSRVVMMIAALAAQEPQLYFWMEVTLYNVLLILAHRLQSRNDKKLLATIAAIRNRSG